MIIGFQNTTGKEYNDNMNIKEEKTDEVCRGRSILSGRGKLGLGVHIFE